MTAEAQIIPVVKEFERVQKDANMHEVPHTFGSMSYFVFCLKLHFEQPPSV